MNIASLIKLLGLLAKVGPAVKLFGTLVASFGPLGPILGAVGAFLSPVLEAVGNAVVWFFKTLGQAITVSLYNPAVFLLLFSTFIAGGWYLGEWDPMGAKKVKAELAEIKKSNPPEEQTKKRGGARLSLKLREPQEDSGILRWPLGR